MSKVKSPDEKKRLSLALDRRNAYRENDKSSRKNIPRAKAGSHRSERRAVEQVLADVPLKAEAHELVESLARTTVRIKKLKAFKKSPDEPLSAHIASRSTRRSRLEKA
jgi:hypothetical protein